MSPSANNESIAPGNGHDDTPSLKNFLDSKEAIQYLNSLSNTIHFDLRIFSESGTLLLETGQNQLCHIFLQRVEDVLDCPESCKKLLFEPLSTGTPVTYKCSAQITNFSVPITYLNEKAIVSGRNGFGSYEDFLAFLKIAGERGISDIPITRPLHFIDEKSVGIVSEYVRTSMAYILDNRQEMHKLTEKLGRFTSLVDMNILEKLSKNTIAIYRYIIDTVEFILGPTSMSILILDNETLMYKTANASGKNREQLMDLSVNAADTFIQQVQSTRSHLCISDLEVPTFARTLVRDESDVLHFFPIFIEDTLEGLIVIFDKALPPQDIKILKAFSDYIGVTLENHSLHLALDQKLEEILVSMSDMSRSIASVLNYDELLDTIVSKSAQLLSAEQGSLMLLDSETSELMVQAKKGLAGIEKAEMKSLRGEGIAWKVLETGEPLLVKDLEKDPRVGKKNKAHYKTKSFLSVPIKLDDRIAGVLNMVDKKSGDHFDENDLNFLQSFIPNMAIAIERSSLHEKTEELRMQSLTDPLTGTLNRRYLNDRLAEEISRFRRYKHSFCLLMLDIDDFKKYNDTFGHTIGDRILKALSETLTVSLRNIDVVARFGGDEFVVILPQTPKVDAIAIANRVKENIEKSDIEVRLGLPPNHLTVSMGLSSYPDDASSSSELLEKTDQALYLAKKGGKNRLVHL